MILSMMHSPVCEQEDSDLEELVGKYGLKSWSFIALQRKGDQASSAKIDEALLHCSSRVRGAKQHCLIPALHADGTIISNQVP